MKIKRNTYRMDLYKEKYGYVCMNPDCKSGIGSNTHHIVPLSKGGSDSEENYIILCKFCHYQGRRHSEFEEQEIPLATWKYYFESLREYQKNHPEDEKEDLPLIKATMPLKETIEKEQEIPCIKPKIRKELQIRAKKHHKKSKSVKQHPKIKKPSKIGKDKFWVRISYKNGGRKIRKRFLMDATTHF